VLKDKARIQRQANDRPLNPGEKCELHFLTILYPPEIPALNADHQAFLEREPISSECPFDSDGLPIEYHRPVCPAPERVRRQHQKLLQGNPTIHGHSPNRNPTPKKIFKSSSWYRASALSIVNCPRKKGD
jgi:hypothetical protein